MPQLSDIPREQAKYAADDALEKWNEVFDNLDIFQEFDSTITYGIQIWVVGALEDYPFLTNVSWSGQATLCINSFSIELTRSYYFCDYLSSVDPPLNKNYGGTFIYLNADEDSGLLTNWVLTDPIMYVFKVNWTNSVVS
jgi:hypothetical protein